MTTFWTYDYGEKNRYRSDLAQSDGFQKFTHLCEFPFYSIPTITGKLMIWCFAVYN
jgi:hypothetical protein